MSLTYAQALDYLFGLINYEHKASYQYSSATFQLGRFRSFLELLGNPHTGFPALHIAGTKGKGSVAALCESALRAAGYHTGLYTSPHLVDFRERIQVDRELVPEQEFADLVERVQPAAERYGGLTWFEVVTALAFLHFARRRVDVAVLEVGLGGRLDATNVVSPLVAVITSISLDHMQLLGSTIGAIAGEKAGIIKPGVPVVSAPQLPEAAAVIAQVAAEHRAPLLPVSEYLAVTGETAALTGQTFAVEPRRPIAGPAGPGGAIPAEPPGALPPGRSSWRIPLAGEHQLANAATALLALDVVARRGLPLSAEALRQGLANVQWPARFQVLREAPAVVLDAAHNPDSAEKLARTIRTLFPGRPLTLIFGASADKDIPGMLRALVPLARRVVLTRAPNARAADPEVLAEQVAALGVPPEVTGDVGEALARALQGAGPDDVVVATGSVFVAGALTDVWARNAGGLNDQSAV